MPAGETQDVIVNYYVFDAFVEIATSAIFSVTGKNDAPVVAGVMDAGSVSECGAPLTLSLLEQTTDADHLDVVNVPLNKGSGVTATVRSGTWTAPIAFTLTNNQLTLVPAQFMALGATESVGLTFTYKWRRRERRYPWGRRQRLARRTRRSRHTFGRCRQ